VCRRLDEKLGLEYLGLPGTNGPSRLYGGWPQFNISNYANLGNPGSGGDGGPVFDANRQTQYTANASWIRGTHNVRFGGDIVRQALNRFEAGADAGVFNFGGGATAAVNVAENGTAVTTVTATDADAGATLTYSITGGADAAKFTINSTTGVLSFVSAPDAESPTDAGGNNVYDVQVQVSDGTNTDSQDIAVTVTNVNDNAPVITSNGGGASASVSVAENSTVVTTVTATDADAGSSLIYSIAGGADAARLAVPTCVTPVMIAVL